MWQTMLRIYHKNITKKTQRTLSDQRHFSAWTSDYPVSSLRIFLKSPFFKGKTGRFPSFFKERGIGRWWFRLSAEDRPTEKGNAFHVALHISRRVCTLSM
jgi:hypothetical protein